ncbi:sugar-binding transcriptional regulator [Lichenicola cladoniae]|uniref:Sugar-binding transcriptional regulator n=2 Tax=Lichenicola cladoniae TaxID=1484109 RepID=A0A6M8HWY1_9PROT|nr:sugar-binding transcriptional regulator [Acetobacteraceae bacterium]QKE92850.1 sugar-binding transcriptional regulator [Lichenicola cladoniae]
MVRAAWLYHVGGMTQEEVARRLGVHRTRVVRLLSDAREKGLVSVTINHETIRDLEVEDTLTSRYGLDFCIATPRMGFELATDEPNLAAAQDMISRRAVGAAAANFLKGKLTGRGAVTVGVSWGRTLEQMALHLSGVQNSRACFVSLMGSLTRNSASNPFEVVQALAARTGGEAHFLPVPFIADTEADRAVFMSQRTVAEALALARSADVYMISVGELSDTAFLRKHGMLSASELRSVRAKGAVADSLGRLFNRNGAEVDHELTRRTLAVDFTELRGRDVVLAAAGLQKMAAVHSLLRTGVVRGLIIDGDTAYAVASGARNQ